MAHQGGIWASAGFRYQYLRTIEALLDVLLEHDSTDVIHTEDQAAAGVDYSVRTSAGDPRLLAQVKHSMDPSATRAISESELLALLMLISESDADSYLIQTNRRLSPNAQRLATTLESSTSEPELTALLIAARGSDAVESHPFTPQRLGRLRRARVEVDNRSSPEVYDALRDRIIDLRRAVGRGVGPESSRLLVNHLINEVFDRSARLDGAGLTLEDLRSLLFIDGLVAAKAAGTYDWGVFLGDVPQRPSTQRTAALGLVAQPLSGPIGHRTPRRVAVVGLSGIGKTSLASLYAHDFAAAYDWIGWVDCESTSTLRRSMERIIDVVGTSEQSASLQDVDDEEHARSCAQALSTLAGSWLMILDGAVSAEQVGPWVPVHGRVDCIATSTDVHAWHGWTQVIVNEMSLDESRELILNRLGRSEPIAPLEVEPLDALVRQTDGWPLAIELACAYLTTSGRGLNFAAQYLRAVSEKAYASETLLPGYPKTLIAAVEIAIEEATRDLEWGASARGAIDALAFMPAAGVPMQTAIQAAAIANQEEYDYEALPQVSPIQVDETFRLLRRRGLVRRLDGVHTRSVRMRDMVVTNEVILQVVRLQLGESGATCVSANLATLSLTLIECRDRNDYHALKEFLPICMRLAEYLTINNSLRMPLGLIFLGNLGEQLLLQGETSMAERLLTLEIALLDEDEVAAYPLRAKIYSALANCVSSNSARVDEVVMLVRAGCLCLELSEGHLDVDNIAIVLSRLRGALLASTRAGALATDDASALRERLDSLAERSGAVTSSVLRTEGALGLLESIDDHTTIAELRARLETAPIDLIPAIRAGLVEAQASAGDLDGAAAELDRFADECERIGVPESVGSTYLMNTLVQYLLMLMLRPAQGPPHYLTRRLMERLEQVALGDYDRYLLLIMRAASEVLEGSASTAMALVAQTEDPPARPLTRPTDVAERTILGIVRSMLEVREQAAGCALTFPGRFLIRRQTDVVESRLAGVRLHIDLPDATPWPSTLIRPSATWFTSAGGVGVIIEAARQLDGLHALLGAGQDPVAVLWFAGHREEQAAWRLARVAGECEQHTWVELMLNLNGHVIAEIPSTGMSLLASWAPDPLVVGEILRSFVD